MQLQLYNPGQLPQKETVSECLKWTCKCSADCKIHWQVRCSEFPLKHLKTSVLAAVLVLPSSASDTLIPFPRKYQLGSELMKGKARGCCSKFVFKTCMKRLPFCLVQRLSCNVRKVWGSAVRTYGVSQQALGAAGGLGQESPVAVWSHFYLFRLFLVLQSHLQNVNQAGIWTRHGFPVGRHVWRALPREAFRNFKYFCNINDDTCIAAMVTRCS